ncbi:MAG TPA: sulfite reductase [NADPH] flavoprotein alpha-component, partial [Gammaproteobacteria bacterium]
RLHARVDCDVDYEAESESWLDALSPALKPFQTPKTATKPAGLDVSGLPAFNSAPRSIFTKKNPFPAPLVENIVLNGRGSGKETRHLEFLLEDSGISYEPGDALGVYVCNPKNAVERLCEALQFDNAKVTHKGTEMPLQQCLEEQVEVTTLTGKFLAQWAEWSGADELKDLVADGKNTHEFCSRHHIEDLAKRYPVRGLPADEFVQALRPLQPRLYSIASSLEACPDEVHLTLSVVRYTLNERQCCGVASGFLANCKADAKVPVYVQHNPNFKLPTDPDTPIIMIGAGTGVAPYRAFLQSLEAGGHHRRSWLFFGDRCFRTDFLYQVEWQRYLKEKRLTRMDVAFSRDQADKVYVQHKMLEQAKDLYEWLEDGAVVYVCGDANRLAPDVHNALQAIVARQRGCDALEAGQYLKDLRQNKRYQQDVY